MIIISYPDQLARIAERWWGPKGWCGLWQTTWMALSKTRTLPVLERSSWKSQKSLPQEVRHGATGVCRVKEVSSLQGTKQTVPRYFLQGCESPPQTSPDKVMHLAAVFADQHCWRCSRLPSPARSLVAVCFLRIYVVRVRFTGMPWFHPRAKEHNYKDSSLSALCPHPYWKASSERLKVLIA